MKKSIWKDLAVMLFSLFVLLVFCEIGTRFYDVINGHNFFDNSHRDLISRPIKKIIPFRIFGNELYKERDNNLFIQSSHGELNPFVKNDSTFRIVCFGGSTTRNSRAFKKSGIHYPLVLQKKLAEHYADKKIEVINVGYEAYSSPHSLIILTLHVASWSPDLTIFMHNHNDLTAQYWPNFRLDYSNKYEQKYYLPDSQYEKYTTFNLIFRWSSFYWFVKNKVQHIFKKNEKIEKQIKSYGDLPLESSQKVFVRNLKNFITISKTAKADVILMSQPMNENAAYSDFVPGDKSTMLWPSHKEYQQHHSYFNKLIGQVSIANNSYFLNNDEIFANDSTYFIDALHYTEKGVNKLSTNLFEFIKENNIIK